MYVVTGCGCDEVTGCGCDEVTGCGCDEVTGVSGVRSDRVWV